MLNYIFIWLGVTALLGLIPFFWRFPVIIPFFIIGDFFEALFHGAIHYAIWDVIRFIFSLIFLPSIIVGRIIVFFIEETRRPDMYRRRDR